MAEHPAKKARKLAVNVAVGGDWYGPDHGNADKVPANIAEQITNPAAWGEDTES